MDTTSRSGLLAFLLALAALGATPAGAITTAGIPGEEPPDGAPSGALPPPEAAAPSEAAAPAGAAPAEAATVEQRLSRIAAAIRAREVNLTADQKPGNDLQVAYGFVNRIGPGGFVNGPYGGAFRNVHPYYGGGRFVNGGGGFVNGGRYGGGGFVNGPYRGGVFRNW